MWDRSSCPIVDSRSILASKGALCLRRWGGRFLAAADWNADPARLKATGWPAIGKSAPVLEVLNSAGEQGVVEIDGERYGAYGWPDLRRNGAKVLLIGAGEPLAEVIALHRLPVRHGICRRGGGLLPSTGRMGRTSVEVTGQDYPDNGRLFAVDHSAIFVMDGQAVHRWDGQRQTAQGSPSACMASLMLSWSQR